MRVEAACGHRLQKVYDRKGGRLTSRHVSSSSSGLSKQSLKGPRTHTYIKIYFHLVWSVLHLWDSLTQYFVWFLRSHKANLFELGNTEFSSCSSDTFVPNVAVLEHAGAMTQCTKFVSHSLTFVSQYLTQSLSRAKPAKWSRCANEIINVIYIWFLDGFWYWGSQLS